MRVSKVFSAIGFSTGGILVGVFAQKLKQDKLHYEDSIFSPYVLPSANAEQNEKDVGIFQKFVNFSNNALTVHAAKASYDGTDSSIPSTYTTSTGASRANEIMRHGFPSFENVRSFDNFVLSYDKRNRNPNWVFEHIKPEHIDGKGLAVRTDAKFVEDLAIHEYFRSNNTDFRGSGYDRGHLAAAANHRHSQTSMDQTFTLSNISPQVGTGFNRDAWNDLEKFVRAIVRKNRCVYVCTGPLYLPRKEPNGKLMVKYEVIGKNHVAVPTHFFKVLVIENYQGNHELMSFVMPNEVLPSKPNLKEFLVPLEAIERASGLLMFNKMSMDTFVYVNGKPV